MVVPRGTATTTSFPDFPDRPLPSPWAPRPARKTCRYRKAKRVLRLGSALKITSPPLPPSPPEGPPLGTNFSLRKATHPLPPSPAFTYTRARSMNIGIPQGPDAKKPRALPARGPPTPAGRLQGHRVDRHPPPVAAV